MKTKQLMVSLSAAVLCAAFSFSAHAQTSAVPLVVQLSPTWAAPQGPAFTLTVTGAQFITGSTVRWNGSPRSTTFVSSDRITASIGAADIANAGTASVTVVSPTGGVSSQVLFPIDNPATSVGFTSIDYPVGSLPDTVGVADLTGTGIMDIVTVEEGSDSVSVLLGNGDGTFQPAVHYPVPASAEGLAFGDFNGDGIIDMVVAGAGSPVVAVLLGTGGGSFGPATAFAAGPAASDVAVGDFNGDGYLDLVVSNAYGNSVSVILGNGNGTFQPPKTFPAAGRTECVAVGDFNGDGKLDVAACLSLGGIDGASIFLGNGDGTLGPQTEYEFGSTPEAAALADLNGDGNADLVFANGSAGNISILLGNGDGTFQPAVNYTTGGSNTTCARIGDFNRDGKLDVVAAYGPGGGVALLIGNGDGTFGAPTTFPVGGGAGYIAVGDFNSDGALDLTATSFPSTAAVLLQNTDALATLNPTTLKFPDVVLGTTSAPKPFTISNPGTGALDLASISAGGPFNPSSSTCGTTLGVNQTCTVETTFSPSAGGLQSGMVTVTDNAATSPQTVSLSGAGTVIKLTPQKLSFPAQTVGTTSAPEKPVLMNTANKAVTIKSIAIAGTNPADFAYKTNCPLTPSTLAAGSRCGFAITFTPSGTGLRTAYLEVFDNGGGSPQILPLSGTGK